MLAKRWSVFLMMGAAVLIAGCEKEKPSAVVRPVKAVRIDAGSDTMTRTFPGRTEAAEEVNLSFRVPGQIFELPVKVGDRLEKGALIAQLDTRDYEIKVRALSSGLAEANAKFKAMKTGARAEDIGALEAELKGGESALNEAELRYNRYKNLYESKTVPKSAFDQVSAGYDVAKAKVEVIRQNLRKAKTGARQEEIEAMTAKIKSLEAQLDAARSALSDTTLKAPFTGYISAKYADNFQTVDAGTPIAKLLDISKLEITAGLPEDLITRRKDFKTIRCRFEAIPGRTFEARVKEIGAEASRQTQTYPVTVILDQPEDVELLAGMTAEVEFDLAAPSNPGHHPFMLPTTAVFTDGKGGRKVWIFDEASSTVRAREIKVGPMGSEGVAVEEGIKPGDWVVTAGVHYLQDGQKVRLMKNEAVLSRGDE